MNPQIRGSCIFKITREIFTFKNKICHLLFRRRRRRPPALRTLIVRENKKVPSPCSRRLFRLHECSWIFAIEACTCFLHVVSEHISIHAKIGTSKNVFLGYVLHLVSSCVPAIPPLQSFIRGNACAADFYVCKSVGKCFCFFLVLLLLLLLTLPVHLRIVIV